MRPHWEGFGQIREFLAGLDFEAFGTLWGDGLYLDAFLTAIRIAGTATLLALLIGFSPGLCHHPCAQKLAEPAGGAGDPAVLDLVSHPRLCVDRHSPARRRARSHADGPRPHREPLRLLNTETAVLIGMVYSYLPFRCCRSMRCFEKMDRSLIEAAADLGAKPLTRFLTITVPLAKPGILAGCFLVFVPGKSANS